MLQALRKRAMRSFSILFVASAALAVAMKKMFKDQFAEEDKEASERQTQVEQQQQHAAIMDNGVINGSVAIVSL